MDPTATQSGPAGSEGAIPAVSNHWRGTIIGRFTVLEERGRGGMGVVYGAYDPELDRRVALKLLRPESRVLLHDVEPIDRLVREGQTMAKISHPNVVTVYDVGVFEDQVFLAMEFVDGPTLAEWRGASWREIVEVYLGAGRGLAAAHAAGLVHCDFKPANVVLTEGAIPKVTDFGLAHDPAEAAKVAGTPHYMAPEQRKGLTSPASDQWSYCKALSEALEGKKPPERIARALARGLDLSPTARFPSMDALLAELARDGGARRRVFAVAALGLVIAGGTFALVRPTEAPCQPQPGRYVGVWDPAVRQTVRAAFTASGAPVADEAFASVARRLDAWVDESSAAATQACEATHVRREQSADLLDLRTSCLGDRIEEVRAFTGLLAHADAATVAEAPQAAYKLRRIDDCADTQTLLSPERPPADKRAKVTELRTRLAAASAASVVGHFADARKVAETAADEARTLPFRPVLAEALIVAGGSAAAAGDFDVAQKQLAEATWMAEASRHDRAAAQAWMLLVNAHTEARALDRADQAAERASAAIARLDGDSELEIGLNLNRGKTAYARGNFSDARAFQEKALAQAEATHGPADPLVGHILVGLAASLDAVGEMQRAEEAYRRAATIYEKSLGPNHPAVGRAIANEATHHRYRGDLDGTIALSQRAIGIYQRSVGFEHMYLGHAYLNLGGAYLAGGKFADARVAFENALAIYEKKMGAESSDVAKALSSLGMTLQLEGDIDAALPLLERAVTIHVAKQGRRHPDTAMAELAHGDALLWHKDFKAAASVLEEALSVVTEAHGKQHPFTAAAETDLARAYLGTGKTRAALPLLEHALTVQEAVKDPDWLAVTRFTLARALWDVGGDRSRARELAEKAVGSPASLTAPDLDAKAWLAAREN